MHAPRHYFDHNATSPLAPEVLEAVISALRDVAGNASSVHGEGQLAKQRLESSRRTLAQSLGCFPDEIVFTSGGTESDNLAILGVARGSARSDKHVITTSIEHLAVLESCRQLEREGVAVSYAQVDSSGFVDPDQIQRLIRPSTLLISVMHANNETGSIQPLSEIAKIARERGVTLHSDGVQALGKIQVDVQALGCDLYSVSAHKLHAPKGIGALYVRKLTPLHGIQFGGRHERERRPGTENVPGAISFACAANLNHNPEHLAVLRDHFEEKVLGTLDTVRVNGTTRNRLPNTSNLVFPGVSGEALVISLDMKGMAVSSGSACSSGAIEPSHVLLAMGLSPQQARSSVRFSFGRYNTLEEVDLLADTVISCVRQLQNHSQREVSLATI